MPQGVEVQVLSSAPLPRSLMVGRLPLEEKIMVRIHAGQQKIYGEGWAEGVEGDVGEVVAAEEVAGGGRTRG